MQRGTSALSGLGAGSRRELYIHKRKNGIFYVEFINSENGKKLPARSTGETVRSKAEAKAEFWLLNGIPTGRTRMPRPLEEAAGIDSVIRTIRKSELNADDAMRIVSTLKSLGLIDIAAVKNTGQGAVPFADFLKAFWDYDKSGYIRDKIAHGQSFHKTHARECMNRVKSVLVPFFGDKKLNCITTDDLRILSSQLSERGLATSTINQITLCARTPLKWAYEQKIIPENPCIGLTSFSVTNERRGILHEAEVKAVFAVTWKDKRAYVASLIAASTGARLGEIRALRHSDIGENTLNIANSYSAFDGLKCPKNGEKRFVPLLPKVKTAILDLLEDNPHDTNDPFIFYSLLPNKPCDGLVLLNGFKNAMDSVNTEYMEAAKQEKKEKPEIQIDYKSRNIVFHSWRHWFCTIADNETDAKKVKKVSGHLSDDVFRRYASHTDENDLQEVGEVIEKAFEKIIPFKKVG